MFTVVGDRAPELPAAHLTFDAFRDADRRLARLLPSPAVRPT
jgi:hypothetical protein